MKKKLLSVLLTVAMVAAMMVGCGSSEEAEAPAEEAAEESAEESAEEGYTVAMLTYSLAEEFGVDVVKGAQEVADKYGITLVAPDPAGDVQKDISIMEDMITQQVDAICIAPVDADALVPYIDMAREAGIIVVNWDIETEAEVEAKVLTDNFAGGAMGADYLVEKMGTEGKVFVVADLESVTTCHERTQGFVERMAEIAPNVELITDQISSGTRDTHRTTVENMLQAHPDITGIFAPDGDRTLGAYVACEANNRQDVLIAGYDGTPEQKAIMQEVGPECNMICSTDLHPDNLGRTSVEVAYKLLQGEEVEFITMSPIDLMTAEGVNQ